MKLSRRQQEIDARKAQDTLGQAVGRDDIDYGTDELPTAPREVATISPDTAPYADPDTVRLDWLSEDLDRRLLDVYRVAGAETISLREAIDRLREAEKS